MSKKQLITTAFEPSWYTDEDMFFLGEWCKPYARKDYWSNLSCSVLPYHWDDREKLYRDSKYVSKVVDKFMSLFADELNTVHGLNWTEKSWQIVLLPWLTFTISCLYDRYHSLLTVADNQRDTMYSTICDKISDMEIVPHDFHEAENWFVDNDAYNFLIYSYILKNNSSGIALVELENSNINWENLFYPKKNYSFYHNLSCFVRKHMINIFGYFKKFNTDILYTHTYFPISVLSKLQLKLKSFPYLDKINIDESRHSWKIDTKLRNSLVTTDYCNDFESFCAAILPKIMPMSYLEGFKYLYNKSISYYPKSVKVLLTANIIGSADSFKIYSAIQSNVGAKLNIIQHGGHYGAGKFCLTEALERKLSSKYFSWGWSEDDNDNKKVIPMPASKLICRKQIHPKSDGDILVTVLVMPRYSYRLYSFPVGETIDHYFNLFEQFIEGLTPTSRAHVNCRIQNIYPKNSTAQRIHDFNYNLHVSNTKKSFINALKGSRLCVSTYNATTFLETMSLNFPTVIFWDDRYFELRDEAIPFYNKMREAGILYYNAYDAAKHINAIFDDPMAWWAQDHVQAAKNIFCERFAFVGENAIDAWSQKLHAELITETK